MVKATYMRLRLPAQTTELNPESTNNKSCETEGRGEEEESGDWGGQVMRGQARGAMGGGEGGDCPVAMAR